MNNIGFDSMEKKKCHADFISATDYYKKLDPNSSKKNMVNDVSFAPFLMWNDHNTKYFEGLQAINSMAINDNNTYDVNQFNNDDNNYSDLMKEAYYSLENMDIIQNMIIKEVYYKSGEKLRINKIKSETLIQCMNHMWTNYCRFLPYNYKEQIRSLNHQVANYLVPLLLKESVFYFNYLRDANRSNLTPLERPIMIVKDRKQQLPSFYR